MPVRHESGGICKETQHSLEVGIMNQLIESGCVIFFGRAEKVWRGNMTGSRPTL
jgi:hypothetical protein